MKRFEQFLTEATEFKNTHLPHLEDLAVTKDGAQFAIRVLKQLGDMLNDGGVSGLNVSVKWDGAPAVVFGPDPKDGQFFVGTKSVFNNTPKMAKSHVDIDAMYPPSITPILHVCFDKLQTLHPGVVLQGDVLFTKDMLGTNEDFWTFQPNTLKYQVPQASQLGRQIDRKELGIALHTMYIGTGTELRHLSGVPLNPDTYAQLRHAPDVLALDANYDDVSGNAKFTPEEHEDFLLALASVEMAVDALFTMPEAFTLAAGLGPDLSRFINHCIRTGTDFTPQNLVDFLIDRKVKVAATRRTPAGQQAIFDNYTDRIQAILDNGPAITAWMRLHADLAKAKTLIIYKLASAVSIFTTVQDADGERKVGPEGFVVTVGNTTVKLVDRPVFSRLNFTLPRSF